MSGVLALDSAGTLVGSGDVKAQTRHVLESIKAVVEAAGGSLDDIVYNAIFLKDLADYGAMNEVYTGYPPSPAPDALLYPRDAVKPECLIEISSAAHLGRAVRHRQGSGQREPKPLTALADCIGPEIRSYFIAGEGTGAFATTAVRPRRGTWESGHACLSSAPPRRGGVAIGERRALAGAGRAD